MKKIIYSAIVVVAFVHHILNAYGFFDRNDYEVRGGAIPSMLGVIVGAVLIALLTAALLYLGDMAINKLLTKNRER